MSVFESSPFEHMMRKLNSSAHTLYAVSDMFDLIEEPTSPDERADLVLLAEDIMDVVVYITERSREVAWQYTPTPEREF